MIICIIIVSWIGCNKRSQEFNDLRKEINDQIIIYEQMSRNEILYNSSFSHLREVFSKREKLSKYEHDLISKDLENLFRARNNAEIDSFFNLPNNERTKELDKRIKAQNNTNPAQNNSSNRQPNRNNNSEDARNARSKRRIDNSTPQERSKNAEYRRLMDQRRNKLGL